MTYQPTKKDLEEMMFNKEYGTHTITLKECVISLYNDGTWFIEVRPDYYSEQTQFYPQSKSDIECLIRMLNPNK